MNTNEFQADIGILFKDDRILKEALTHRSFINENQDWPYEHNERLEFLGDAVLELSTTKYLFRVFPKSEEGELTMIRAALVNTKMLAKIAGEINLGEHLMASRGEDGHTEAILADAFEALIGAIYLDQGYDAADKFIRDRVISHIDEVKEQGYRDPKSVLQEEVQGKLKITPTYKILKESGPEHQKIFEVGVFLGEKMEASGTGTSKQAGETDAARKALAKLLKETD
ncbi:MAG: ribonuclease III [Candidatus Colwellbacteria bacterium]|jgi:ribonuclease-3|nr:ribonuclease III [Candidatus Colwellbacteria bacterium]MCK9497688.1 ribonuclease III [Candidatus Colwellbacteria bacterium]MDD3752613.1 ribonuclease III [Candidatus Colwellbacteria bacterium]MDD4818822.1 ribonuclease III [Candidatus Colwellbacteria bacterium]